MTKKENSGNMPSISQGLGFPVGANRRRLFVDIDGTLAEWRSAPYFEVLLEKGYFRSLAPHQKVVEAVKRIISCCSNGVEVFTLSAYLTESLYALDDKRGWLDEHLPEIDEGHRLFSPCGEDKALYVPGGIQPTDLLLDDYTVNLRAWAKHGRALKLLNGINGTNGTWKGPAISMNQPVSSLAGGIIQVLYAGV